MAAMVAIALAVTAVGNNEDKGKSPLWFFFAVVQFVLQLCNVFCSCAFCLADVLKLCIIPTYNFADVQMK
jgi:hypothetical protein